MLHAAGRPIEHVYIPLSGMVSLLAIMKTGQQIETGMTGREARKRGPGQHTNGAR